MNFVMADQRGWEPEELRDEKEEREEEMRELVMASEGLKDWAESALF
jgi:hypothetical protein